VTALTNDSTTVTASFSAALSAGDQTVLATLVANYTDPPRSNNDEALFLTMFNSTVAPLAANAVFTGTWEDVSDYSFVGVTALSNQASAVGGVSIQFGLNAAQADVTKTYSLLANTPITYSLTAVGRYFRVVYTNGATLQTTFSVQTRFFQAQVMNTVDLGSTVNSTAQAIVVKSSTLARQDFGAYVEARADEDRRLRVRINKDSAIGVDGGSAIVQVSYPYSINPELSNTAVIATGTVTQATGCAVLSTAPTATSSAVLSSRRYVYAGAGRIIRVVVACAFTAGVANSNQICGMGTAENGFFVGYNGTVFGVLVRSNSVDTWIPQTTFNVDACTGTGPSGVTIDPTKGNTFLITYDTCGFGGVSFAFSSTPVTAPSEAIVMHRLVFNTAITPGLRSVTGPLYAQAVNTTNATLITLRVASMAAFADFPVVKLGSFRSVDFSKTISTATYVPVLTIFNKSTFSSQTNTISLLMKSLALSSDGTKGSSVVALFDNAVLTNSAFADINTANSPAQLDTAATSLSGGVMLLSVPIFCRSNIRLDLTMYDMVLSPNSSITVACRCSTTATANGLTASLAWSADK
jgi:hypothetical protein